MNRLYSISSILGLFTLLYFSSTAEVVFYALGDLPGGDFESYAYDVSADGSVVVGWSDGFPYPQAFIWTKNDGLVSLNPDNSDTEVFAFAISTDGSTVAGHYTPGGYGSNFCKAVGYETNIQTGAGQTFFPSALSGGGVSVYGISGNGSVVVGRDLFCDEGTSVAIAWGSGIALNTPSEYNHGFARAISDDESVVVGQVGLLENADAAIWTTSGLQILDTVESAYGVTPDGSIVVGGQPAFQWTQSQGLKLLGFDKAYDISANGRVIVGEGQGAIVWKPDSGAKLLAEILAENGINMTGWSLEVARGVSADGSTIVGWGKNPDGNTEAFVVTGLASPTLMDISLEMSLDMQNWIPADEGAYDISTHPLFFRVRIEPHISGMSFVSGGTFSMGLPAGEPGSYAGDTQHSVTVSRPFYINQYEVSWTEWNVVRDWTLLAENDPLGYDIPTGRMGGGEGEPTIDHPVTSVSWFDAIKWCNAKSEMNGLTPVYYTDSGLSSVYRSGQIDLINTWVDWSSTGYRLPTEAEWEFACRAGTQSSFFTGPITATGSGLCMNLDLAGWYSANSGNVTHPVGQKAANANALHDTHGNVWEWTWDRHEAFSSNPVSDPRGPDTGSLRTARGGSFNNNAENCQSSSRFPASPNYNGWDIGFRVARTQ
jgi:formylglycine-generating enzyme required for sulfatase activity/uncharacterized membrane protein